MTTQDTARGQQVLGWLCIALALAGLAGMFAFLLSRPAAVSGFDTTTAEYARFCAPVFGNGDDDGVTGDPSTQNLENECVRGREQALGWALLCGLCTALSAVAGAAAFTVRYRRYPASARLTPATNPE